MEDYADFAAALQAVADVDPTQCWPHAKTHCDLPVTAAGDGQVYLAFVENPLPVEGTHGARLRWRDRPRGSRRGRGTRPRILRTTPA